MSDRGKAMEAIIAAIDEIAIIVIVMLMLVGILYDIGYITMFDAVVILLFLIVVSGLIVFKVIESQKEIVKMGLEAIVGKHGYASDNIEPGDEGYVIIEGEYWKAVNVSNRAISKDEKIRVVSFRGLLLEVVPYNEEGPV